MCEIVVVKYIHSDGRKETVEKKRLCRLSDGQNPCYHDHVRREVTEMVRPGTPSLTYDTHSPMSTSIPGTPVTATAPTYVIREPTVLVRNGPEAQEKTRHANGSLGEARKRSMSSEQRSHRERQQHYHHHLDEENDPTVAIDAELLFEPSSTRPDVPTISLGSPLPTRPPPHRPAIIHQPKPPSRLVSYRLRQVPQPSYHRRVVSAPESVCSPPENDVVKRANARDELRRQNQEYQRRKDQEKRQLDDVSRRLAEKLENERKEEAMDEYSLKEYQRLQEKDAKRRREWQERQREKEEEEAVLAWDREELERRQADMKGRVEQEALERREADMKDRLEREMQRQRIVDDELRLAEELRRRDERQKRDEQRAERPMEETLEAYRRERESGTASDIRDIQAQINKLDSQLRSSEEHRAARARAAKVDEEVRQYKLLQKEIGRLEEERRRGDLADNESELRKLEAEYNRLNFRVGVKDGPVVGGYSPIDGPRFGERRNIDMAPPRSPVDIVQRQSPISSEEYRRALGEQVLERERSRSAAQVATVDLQGAMDLGLFRRKSIGAGAGGNRAREQNYRNLRKWYPE